MVASLLSMPLQIQMLQDLMLIELEDFTCETVYFIKDEEDKTIRKGKFTGHQIQLNFIHLPSGQYQLGFNRGEEVITYAFKKHDGFYTFQEMYVNEPVAKYVA